MSNIFLQHTVAVILRHGHKEPKFVVRFAGKRQPRCYSGGTLFVDLAIGRRRPWPIVGARLRIWVRDFILLWSTIIGISGGLIPSASPERVWHSNFSRI